MLTLSTQKVTAIAPFDPGIGFRKAKEYNQLERKYKEQTQIYIQQISKKDNGNISVCGGSDEERDNRKAESLV
jgi:hypothetical protein